MAYDVITHGGGEGLVYAFNAVAALFNGKRALGASLVYIASAFATAIAVITMVAKQELLPTAKWFFGSFMITMALMVPKVNIIVKDRITKLETPVAHVPFLLGVFAGISSQLGDILAKKMDAVFSQAGPDYTGHGVAMASQLLSKVNHFHIRDPLMSSNVRGFVQQCMVFDIAKGKYSIKELHHTDDIWKLFRENASEARGFVYKSFDAAQQKQGRKPVRSKILTCKEGADEIEKAWNDAYKQAAFAYGPRLYPSAPNPTRLFMENLPLAHHYLTKLSHSAESILQQSMMSNAIDDGLLELNQLTDANAAVTAYAAKRAQAQQRVAYSLQGHMASLSLSVLKVVVEILFYGLFPIVVVISIFPGGWVVIKKYLIALFWIQSWAPMYAILNMVMNVYGKSKSVAAVTTIGKGAFNIYALRGLGEANEWVSSVAGYVMMSVPFLSYGIIHYGAGALSQLSTHFGSVTQSAASHAAEEATTGNYSMGNTHFDTHNRSNVSGFKYDTNTSVLTGRTTFQREDGALVSMNRHQTVPVLDRTPAISNLGASFNQSDGLQLGYQRMAEQSHREGMQHMSSAQENLSSALHQFQAMSDNHRTGKDLSKTFVHGEAVYKDSGLATLSAASDELSDALHIDRSVANQMLVKGGGDGNIGVGGTKTGVGISLGGSGSHDERTTNSETQKAIKNIVEKYDLQNVIKKTENEAAEGRYSLVDSEGKMFDGGIRASLDKVHSHQKLAQASFSKEEAYRESAQLSSTHGVDSSQNLSNEVLKRQIEKEGMSDALTSFSDNKATHIIREDFIGSEKPVLEQEFKNQTVYVSPEQLVAQYQKDNREIAAIYNPETEFDNNQKFIVSLAEKENLTKPVVSDIPEKVEQSMIEAEEIIKNKQNEFFVQKAKSQKKHSDFKEDNEVTDYGKKVKNFIKSISNMSFGGSGSGERKTNEKVNGDTKEIAGEKE